MNMNKKIAIIAAITALVALSMGVAAFIFSKTSNQLEEEIDEEYSF